MDPSLLLLSHFFSIFFFNFNKNHPQTFFFLENTPHQSILIKQKTFLFDFLINQTLPQMSYSHSNPPYSSPSAPPLSESPSGWGHPYQAPPNYYGQGQGQGQGSYGSYGYPSFPPGTHPEVIRSFQMVDRDRSGFIDENELQQGLSSGFQRFSIRTVRLLMFLFKNPHDSLRIG